MEEYSCENFTLTKSSFGIFKGNDNSRCDSLQIILDTIIDGSQDFDISMSTGDLLLSQSQKPKYNRTVKEKLKIGRDDEQPKSSEEKTIPKIAPTSVQSVDAVHSTPEDNRPHRVLYEARDGKLTKMWQCRTCLRKFRHQYTLVRHLPTHTDVRNFVCRECGKAFRQLSTLSQHRAIHSTERPFACEICEKTFNRSSTLISHRKTHTGVKPFHCSVCNKGFHQKGNLKNHIYIHTNERPYRCTICDKGFNQMSNLVCHTQKSHPSECGSLWACNICSMSFTKRALLRAHELATHRIPGTNVTSNRRKLATILKSTKTTAEHIRPGLNEKKKKLSNDVLSSTPILASNGIISFIPSPGIKDKINILNKNVEFLAEKSITTLNDIVSTIQLPSSNTTMSLLSSLDIKDEETSLENTMDFNIRTSAKESIRASDDVPTTVPPRTQNGIISLATSPDVIKNELSIQFVENAGSLIDESFQPFTNISSTIPPLSSNEMISFVSSPDFKGETTIFYENSLDLNFGSSVIQLPSSNTTMSLLSSLDIKDEETSLENTVDFNIRTSAKESIRASDDVSTTMQPRTQNGIISLATSPDVKNELSIQFDENKSFQPFTDVSSTIRPLSSNEIISFVSSPDFKDEKTFYENSLDFNIGLAQEYIKTNDVPSTMPTQSLNGMISFIGENENTLDFNYEKLTQKECKVSAIRDPLLWYPIKSGMDDAESTLQFLEATSFLGTYGNIETDLFNTQPTKISNDFITDDNFSSLDHVLLDSCFP